MRVGSMVVTLGLFVSVAAGAQTVPISRTIPVTFTGVVSSTAADTILVRQPDGSLTTSARANRCKGRERLV